MHIRSICSHWNEGSTHLFRRIAYILAVSVRIFSINVIRRIDCRGVIALHPHRNLTSIDCDPVLNDLFVSIHIDHILDASANHWNIVFIRYLRRYCFILQARSRVFIH